MTTDKTIERRRGFTLVEILVVIVIIGLLVGMLVPAVSIARESGRRITCTNHQGEVGKAILAYESAKRKLPGVRSNATFTYNNAQTNATITWPMSIFSEIGRSDLSDYGTLYNGTAFKGISIDLFICPSDPTANTAGGLSYVVNRGRTYAQSGGATDYTKRLFRDSTVTADGSLNITSMRNTTQTVMLSENIATPPATMLWTSTALANIGSVSFEWPELANNAAISTVLSSNHRGTIVTTFFDGHTEAIPAETMFWRVSGASTETPEIFGSPN